MNGHLSGGSAPFVHPPEGEGEAPGQDPDLGLSRLATAEDRLDQVAHVRATYRESAPVDGSPNLLACCFGGRDRNSLDRRPVPDGMT